MEEKTVDFKAQGREMRLLSFLLTSENYSHCSDPSRYFALLRRTTIARNPTTKNAGLITEGPGIRTFTLIERKMLYKTKARI
jgi:hypothetical protein